MDEPNDAENDVEKPHHSFEGHLHFVDVIIFDFIHRTGTTPVNSIQIRKIRNIFTQEINGFLRISALNRIRP